MSVTGDSPLSRKRLQTIGEQLANDRKLEILSYAADRNQFTVTELKEKLDFPHTTAHEYCRDLQQAGLLERTQEKPAAYQAIEFDIRLSLNDIAAAVETETETLGYAREVYGEDVIEKILDIWERVETGELTYREASAKLGMDHADFLRIAAELELLGR